MKYIPASTIAQLLPARTIEIVTLAFAGGSAVVGLFITFLAIRALRRHQSRQMLLLSVGMVLLFGAAYLVAMVGTVLIHVRVLTLPQQNYVRLLVRALQFVGLVAIASSLVLRE
ncbi:hypothetical protein ACFQJ7_15820 [Halovenus rubra]|uniref:Uncharacterized protein n=2 Tax=Halovenus rubra TaxID=869890 RepID=A0ABD5X867_9EURY|nr:hypothetical protein [Halovenus rubra]